MTEKVGKKSLKNLRENDFYPVFCLTDKKHCDIMKVVMRNDLVTTGYWGFVPCLPPYIEE